MLRDQLRACSGVRPVYQPSGRCAGQIAGQDLDRALAMCARSVSTGTPDS